MDDMLCCFFPASLGVDSILLWVIGRMFLVYRLQKSHNNVNSHLCRPWGDPAHGPSISLRIFPAVY